MIELIMNLDEYECLPITIPIKRRPGPPCSTSDELIVIVVMVMVIVIVMVIVMVIASKYNSNSNSNDYNNNVSIIIQKRRINHIVK